MSDTGADFDLLIVGAGSTGCAAAICAAKRGARVALAGARRAADRVSWVSPDGVALLTEKLGVTAKQLGAVPFSGLTLHDWRGAKHAAVTDDALSGWIAQRSDLDAGLLAAAAKAGAKRFDAEIARMVASEESIAATLAGDECVRARLALIADGADTPLARQCGLIAAGALPGAPACLSVSFDDGGKSARIDVILGGHREGKIATLTRAAGRATLTLVTRDRSTPAESQWAEVVEAARRAELFAGDPGPPARWACPAGLALDLETHIGKRSLLVGDTGGFVAAFSGEGLYPGMWSGARGAEIALDALAEPVPQDAMLRFGVEWRAALADYLRMPNTDLSLLMPLVFGNAQMTARVARAFLCGQPF